MKHVLITNQHGENRGDESALRAMIDGVSNKLGDVKFTVIAQLQDANIDMKFKHDVSLLHMKMPIPCFFGLILYPMLRKVGVCLPFLLDDNAKKIINAYKECDVVVSAPGGPYFGDIYSNHEIVHWFYIWLGLLFKKPLFLYAPSAGPFKIKWLNAIRKHFYKKFDVICLREAISKGYLQELIGFNKEIIVTADSAIQQIVEPMKRSDYFIGENEPNKEKYLVAVSAIEYKFPGESDPVAKQKEYTNLVLECLRHLACSKECHFLFFPQLYGKVHSDIPYLEYLSSSLPENVTGEIVDQSLDSNIQRSILGMCDLCIASRYHPQIFAGTSSVPGVCIYYEHKALGFMELMGLEDYAFDIRNLELPLVVTKLDEIIQKHDKIAGIMKKKMIPLRKQSERTTELLIELIKAK